MLNKFTTQETIIEKCRELIVAMVNYTITGKNLERRVHRDSDMESNIRKKLDECKFMFKQLFPKIDGTNIVSS